MPESQDELTATQIEQIGRILIPAVQVALRDEFQKLRDDFNEALLGQKVDYRERIDALTQRLESVELRLVPLEQTRSKAVSMWATATAAVTFVGTLIGSWLVDHVGSLFKK